MLYIYETKVDFFLWKWKKVEECSATLLLHSVRVWYVVWRFQVIVENTFFFL